MNINKQQLIRDDGFVRTAYDISDAARQWKFHFNLYITDSLWRELTGEDFMEVNDQRPWSVVLQLKAEIRFYHLKNGKVDGFLKNRNFWLKIDTKSAIALASQEYLAEHEVPVVVLSSIHDSFEEARYRVQQIRNAADRPKRFN